MLLVYYYDEIKTYSTIKLIASLVSLAARQRIRVMPHSWGNIIGVIVPFMGTFTS